MIRSYYFFFLVLFLFFLFVDSDFCYPFFLGEGSFDFAFEFSFFSIFFSVVVRLIYISILHFSFFYIKDRKKLNSFNFILFFFFISIIFFVHRNNFFSIFLGWDWLGVSSYLLISFYYRRRRFNNSIFTIITNRVGDFFLIWFLSFFFFSLLCNENINFVFFSILLICRLTKRAQFPFSSWLTRAIRAPTPVSALVHSSTLVTAGFWLLIKFSFSLERRNFVFFLLFISGFTIIISAFVALVERDVKKVIALSTLSQVGLIFFSLRIGNKISAFYHLIFHAFLKSSLFIDIGIFIVLINHNQISKIKNSVLKIRTFSSVGFSLSLFSIVGLFFLTGSISKELFLFNQFFLSYSVLFFFFIIFSIVLTFLYRRKIVLTFLSSSRRERVFLPLSLRKDLGGFLVKFLSVAGGWILIKNFSLPIFFFFSYEKMFVFFVFFVFFITLAFKKNFLFSNKNVELFFGLDSLSDSIKKIFKNETEHFEKFSINKFNFFLINNLSNFLILSFSGMKNLRWVIFSFFYIIFFIF